MKCGAVSFSLVQTGAAWCKGWQWGATWCDMVQCGARRYEVAGTGADWCTVAPGDAARCGAP